MNVSVEIYRRMYALLLSTQRDRRLSMLCQLWNFQSIIRKQLDFIIILACWVPWMWSDNHRTSRMDIELVLKCYLWGDMEDRKKGEENLMEAKIWLSVGKVFATVYWDWSCILLEDYLHERQTINATFCCGHLDQFKLQHRRNRRDCPISEVWVLHENIVPHTAAARQQKLVEMNWSSELSTCDVHMLRPLKEALEGKRNYHNVGTKC